MSIGGANGQPFPIMTQIETSTPVSALLQGGAQSRFGWSWAGFRLLAQAEDGEQERRVVADVP